MSHPAGQRLAPLGRVGDRRDDGGLLEAGAEAVGVDAAQTLEHDGAAPVPLGDHVGADVLEGVARQGVGLGELIQDLDGHVHLPDRAQRLGQLPDLLLGLPPGFGLPGQDRHRFPEAPGGHPRLVHTGIVALDGQRQLAFELPRPAQQ